MRTLSCDVAIVGAGTAGLAARAAAAEAGARTILIERGPGGTTCARVGCMPSKLLIAAARAAREARDLGTFGLRLEGRLVVDGPAVMERVRRERDRFVGAVLEDVAAIPDGQKLDGAARFAGPGALTVGEVEVEAAAIVIATGSRPSIPKPLAALGGRVLTSDTVFELPDLPPSLAVVGAGPLGIELAAAFAGLGHRVALFDKGETLGGLSDPAVAGVARTLLGREMAVHLGAAVEAAPEGADGARITWRGKDGGGGSESFARVLAAAGRTPNLDGLALETTGPRSCTRPPRKERSRAATRRPARTGSGRRAGTCRSRSCSPNRGSRRSGAAARRWRRGPSPKGRPTSPNRAAPGSWGGMPASSGFMAVARTGCFSAARWSGRKPSISAISSPGRWSAASRSRMRWPCPSTTRRWKRVSGPPSATSRLISAGRPDGPPCRPVQSR